MGTSLGKKKQQPPRSRQSEPSEERNPKPSDYKPPTSGHMGETHVASAEARAPWMAEPRVYLANQSKHRVSFWVVQEDKKKTIAHRNHITSAMGAGVDVGHAGGNISANVNRNREESVETEEVDHVLMRDHRMLPNGETQATHVIFPVGCKEVRVFGFFQAGDGEWRRYKEKVYSIERFEKIITLTALESNIVPFEVKQPPNTAAAEVSYPPAGIGQAAPTSTAAEAAQPHRVRCVWKQGGDHPTRRVSL